MKYEHRPHDILAQDWMMAHRRGGLFLEPGLGKTGDTLTAIERKIDTCQTMNWLVTAPNQVARGVWRQEAAKWDHTRHLSTRLITAEDFGFSGIKLRKNKDGTIEPDRILNVAKPREARKRILGTHADITVVPHHLFPWLVRLIGRDRWTWDGVVIDENFKAQSSWWRAACHLLPTGCEMHQLTGTPTPNGLDQLWVQQFLVDEGKRLGDTEGEFQRVWCEPVRMGLNGKGRLTVFQWKIRDHLVPLLHRIIAENFLSMKAEDWLKLPERLFVAHRIEIPMKDYDDLKRDLVLRSIDAEGHVIAANAAVLSGKLLQAANGRIYTETKDNRYVHEEKLQWLEELADNNGNILVAYWFKEDLERIKKRFGKKVLELRTPEDQDAWNRGSVKLGLVQPAGGGKGLNLQDGGSVAAWYGPIHDLEVWQQFNKRLHRPGQQADRVVIHTCLAKDTIDEFVYDFVLPGKCGLQDALMMALGPSAARAADDFWLPELA